MPETTIPVAERRYELLRDIVLPNRYIPAGRVATGAAWIEKGFADDACQLDRGWFMDLTPRPTTVYSEADKLNIFCRDIMYGLGLRSISYIQAAVKCVQLDRANRAANPTT